MFRERVLSCIASSLGGDLAWKFSGDLDMYLLVSVYMEDWGWCKGSQLCSVIGMFGDFGRLRWAEQYFTFLILNFIYIMINL